jgi:predicted phage baseplate assembly protein
MSSALVPPHTSSRRAALLEQLIVALTSNPQNALPIKTRAPDDPTIALLDAWATVGDVLGFYLDRIADEGYLSTATQDGSILALADLIGYQPTPGLAAQVHLAYTLATDPADGAVQYNSGLLVQSVPGPGQQAQTFESAQTVVARPSWNLMAPKSTQPLQPDATSLVVNSTTAQLSPNNVILLAAGTTPNAVTVTSATMDYSAKITNVTVKPLVQSVAQPAAQQASTASLSSSQPTSATTAIDALLAGGLGKPTTPVPESANNLPPGQQPTAKSVFAADSDAVPRLISALQPAVASTLYAALGSTTIGSAPVTGASVMQVTAAPFGATAPPQPVFNASGQPAGTRDWPIADTFTLELSITASQFLRLLNMAFQQPGQSPSWLTRLVDRLREQRAAAAGNPVIDAQLSVATSTGQTTIAVTGLPATASPTPEGFGQLTLQAGDQRSAVLSYAGYTATPSTPQVQVNVSLDTTTDAITFEFVTPTPAYSCGTLIWDPLVDTPLSGQVGETQVTIAWSTPRDREATLTLSIAMPLPLADTSVLLLDGNYPGIMQGSYVVIDSADRTSSSSSSAASSASGSSSSATFGGYPVIATVESANTVATRGFGITGKVTQLTLDKPWIDSSAVLQSALQPLIVYAQPAALALQPAPITDPNIDGSSIDLDGLVAGMEPGRLIAVTGTRTDVPGATAQDGEIAMVASVSTNADAGGKPHSTLNLANALAYSYQRSTVQIYGNVVSARQGATIPQVLGSGQPAQAPQSFTLSSGPLLADPAPTGTGFRSSLTVTVDGVGYTQVNRVDSTTPAQSFVAGTNAAGQTTIAFPAPLPAGTGNISASYRAGDGSQGNLSAGQITQLLSRPASLSKVTNPLKATGGGGGDDQQAVRARAPVSLSALGRVVTLSDYRDLASSIAGVGKASAALTSGTGVAVTIAGAGPVQLNSGDSLCSAVTAAIAAVADPVLPVQVLPANIYLITLTADVTHPLTVSWDATVAAVQAALLAKFGYTQRDLGQDVAVSDLLAAAHAAPSVLSFKVTGLALVPAAASASALSTTLPTLLTAPVPPVATLAAVPAEWQLPAVTPTPAAVAYLSATPGTLILSEKSP